jgi:hypothetical protein
MFWNSKAKEPPRVPFDPSAPPPPETAGWAPAPAAAAPADVTPSPAEAVTIAAGVGAADNAGAVTPRGAVTEAAEPAAATAADPPPQQHDPAPSEAAPVAPPTTATPAVAQVSSHSHLICILSTPPIFPDTRRPPTLSSRLPAPATAEPDVC